VLPDLRLHLLEIIERVIYYHYLFQALNALPQTSIHHILVE
jgi:hypothetical protein